MIRRDPGAINAVSVPSAWDATGAFAKLRRFGRPLPADSAFNAIFPLTTLDLTADGGIVKSTLSVVLDGRSRKPESVDPDGIPKPALMK